MTVITRYPTSNTVSATGWTLPINAYADDSAYTTCAPSKNGTVGSYFGGFNFSDIGANDTINSVTIEFEYHVSTTSSVATLRTSGWDGTTQIGDILYHTAEPTTDLQRTLVIPATVAQLQSANFRILEEGVRGSSNTAVTFYLDYVRVTVDYTPASTDHNGSLSQTLGDAALSASGKVEVRAAVFATLQDTAIVASGHVQANEVTAVLAQTLESVTLSATGKATVKSGLTTYLDSCSATATGKVAVKGSASKVLDSCGLSASGKIAVKGIVNQTLGNATLIATSGATFQPITASANVTLENVGLSATGRVTVNANANIALANVGGVASGKIPVNGRAVIALESVALDSMGAVRVSGGLAKTLSDITTIFTAAAGSPRLPSKMVIIKPINKEIITTGIRLIRAKMREKINTIGRGD